MKFIHYGSSLFDEANFHKISNGWGNKPEGGLWGTPVGIRYGWKEWCEANDFQVEKLRINFVFSLKKSVRILQLDSLLDLTKIPVVGNLLGSLSIAATYVILDYEKLVQDYDAVYLTDGGLCALHYDLCGWDVESIVVLNRDVIEVE